VATPYSPLRPLDDTFTPLDRAADRFGEEQDAARGLVRALTGMTASGLADEALRREVAGQAGWEARRDAALATQQEAAAYAPRISSLRDASGIGDVVDYLQGAAPGAAATTLPSLGAALLFRGRWKPSAFAGAAVPSYLQSRGEIAGEQYADPVLSQASAEERDRAATYGGAAMAALDTVLPGSLANSALRKPARGFLNQMGRDAVTEGLTEVAQTGIQQFAHNTIDPTRGYDGWEMLDAGVAGAAGGAGLAGAMRAPSYAANALLDRFQPVQNDAGGPPAVEGDGGPAPGPIDPDTPLLPAPPTLSDRAADLYETLSERFAPKAAETYEKASDYVSDTIDRMAEAAKTAQSPSEFLRQVFGNSSEEAAADLRPDTEDPIVLNAPDPAAALMQRDAERQQRAARFAEELLSDPATPQSIKERVASFGGDFSSREAQEFVARNLVALRAGEKLANAVADLIDLTKDFGTDLASKARDMIDKSMSAATDRIVKKNLQDINEADVAPLVTLMAQRLGPAKAAEAPKLARQLVAAANRLSPDARITEETDRRLRNFSEVIDDEVLDLVTELSGSDALRNAIAKIRSIPSAASDVRQSGGQSFLESMLKQPLEPAVLGQLAEFVDTLGLQLGSMPSERKNQVLAGLASAFGSKREAQIVVEYYGNIRRDALRRAAERGDYGPDVDVEGDAAPGDVRYDPYEGVTGGSITERDSAPAPTYQFADAKTMRPYRAFAGSELAGGKRRRESVQAAINLKGVNPAARVRPVKMSQYVADTGGDPETEVRRIATDIKNRIAQHKARKDEDRSQQINQLQGELTLLRQAYRTGGAQAALDMYEVLQVSGQEQNDTVATDEDIAKMSTLADAKDAKETRVTFQRTDGKKFTLSAESMWKTMGDKEGSGKGENAKKRAKRLFADAVASVLARPDVEKVLTPLDSNLVVDRTLNLRAKRKPWSDERRAAAEQERLDRVLSGRAGTPARRAALRERVAELEALLEENEAYSDEVQEFVDRMREAVRKADARVGEKLKAAKQAWEAAFAEPENSAERNTAMAYARSLQAKVDVDREVAKDLRDALDHMESLQYEADIAARDDDRPGIPGMDETGPMGPNGLPRTRMNEELGNTGTRYSEEDTGIGVGVEKRGSRIRKNSFVGAKADPQGAEDAEKLLGIGAPADVVWRELGWFRGPDGKLRKEIRSPVLRRRVREFATAIANGTAQPTTIGALLEGIDAFKPYLDKLGDLPIDPNDGMVELAGAIGVYKGEDGISAKGIGISRVNAELAVRMEAVPGGKGADLLREIMDSMTPPELADMGLNFADPRDLIAELEARHPMPDVNERVAETLAGTILHELQHAFQHVEGFENGGNATTAVIAKYGDVDEYLAAVRDGDEDTVESITEQAFAQLRAEVGPDGDMEAAAQKLYESIVGEVEANDVAARMNLSDEEAASVKPALMDAEREFVRSVLLAEVLSTFRSKVNSSKMGSRPGRPGKDWGDKESVKAEILRLRGKDVKVRIEKLVKQLGGSGQYTYNPKTGERLIEVAINARSPLGTARHEAMHDLFRFLSENAATRSIARDLRDATSAPHVIRQLRELLKDHKAALEQLNDPEERAAYAYQFWAEGLLRIGPTGTGIFNTIRQFIRDLFGIVTASQRGEDLMRAFHDGKFADLSTVQEVLQDINDRSGDRFRNKMERAAPELTAALSKIFQVAPDRLRAYQNDTLNKLADMFSSESGELGFIQRRFQQQGVWENKLAGILAGTTAQERRAALDNLQAMKPPSTKLERNLAEFFNQMYDYMSEAGVKTLDSKTKKWVPLRKVKGYFPRMFDRHAIMKDREGFKNLLMKHGNMTAKAAENTINALIHGTGQLDLAENEHALGFTPYAQSVQDRQFTFINPNNAADFAKYQVKDLADVTTGYVKQAVHRAEYARMFGNNGEVIAKMIGESGIKDHKELADIGKIVQGLEGSLGNEMSTETKELMSGIMTLQNAVVLPLALFSQMIDPIVLAARSGELKDAGTAYMTAVKRLMGKEVDGEELASMLGIISQDSVIEAMGAAYGTVHMSKRMRDINRVFFKYNGMQGWNNSMRIAATVAGEKYLLAHKDDAKALAELGLEPKDIKTVLSHRGVKPDANNRVVLRERLDVSNPKVQQAMFRFVDQAVLRPSASNRPVWMSDPRFLLVAHLKQFTYAMHNVVLKRASRELAEGNPKPWATLMLTMPVVLAADMAKFALTGTAPSTWGFKDYLVHAVERSGLLGLGDFGVQASSGVGRGKMPGEELLGPTFENLMEILRWIGGDPRVGFGDVVDRTVPGARFI
jgi:hypothetical protein